MIQAILRGTRQKAGSAVQPILARAKSLAKASISIPAPDPFLLLLVGSVVLASLLPVRGGSAEVAGIVTQAAIGLLFFLHGSKLSREAMLAGLGAWRIHLLVLASTFVLFPVVGIAVRAATAVWIDPLVGAGLLFLTLLPSTVQSSIALTAAAGGNVSAAVCSASLSNILGIVVTPLLAAWLLGGAGSGISGWSVVTIALQLLFPFLLGHLSRPLTSGFVGRHARFLSRLDRGSILLVVFTAFSASVVDGLWQRVGVRELVTILVLDALILALVLAATLFAARRLGFSRKDEIVILFCGSKKSLASGVPMAGALFSPALAGPMILPLMMFHQLQLMVCAFIAGRYAASAASDPRATSAPH